MHDDFVGGGGPPARALYATVTFNAVESLVKESASSTYTRRFKFRNLSVGKALANLACGIKKKFLGLQIGVRRSF